MNFKKWLLIELGIYGSTQDYPGQNLNTNMPVLSNLSTKNGSSKPHPDGMDNKTEPDDIFGMRSIDDKKRSRERRSKTIDKKNKTVPTSAVPPDIIY